MSAASQRPLRPAESVLVAHLDGESVLLDLESKHYYRLNESGSAIWRGVESGAEPRAIADALVSAFDVSESEARAAVEDLLADLKAKGLLVPKAAS
jgi:hypothetical protein